MLHVHPRGFQRVRYYGFLANCVRQPKLTQCRTLLGAVTRPRVRDEVAETLVDDTLVGEPGSVCPRCQQGRMQLVETFHRHPAAWDLSVAPPALDTS